MYILVEYISWQSTDQFEMITLAIFLLFTLLISNTISNELNVIYDEITDTYSLLDGIGNDVNRVGWTSFVDNITETGWSTLESM